MKRLKILPWLAHKAGIADARADELWVEAIRHATDQIGWVGTPEYWKSAMDRLLELIEGERTNAKGEAIESAGPSKVGLSSFLQTAQSKGNDPDGGKLAHFSSRLESAANDCFGISLGFSR